MTHFGPRMRLLFIFCAAMNAGGAVAFLPSVPQARAWVGLPEAPPFYLWVLSSWIALFGACYLWLGLTGTADRTFLAVAAGGKAVFGGMLMALAVTGELLPPAFGSGLSDFVLAGVFAGWLVRFPPPKNPNPSAGPFAGNNQ